MRKEYMDLVQEKVRSNRVMLENLKRIDSLMAKMDAIKLSVGEAVYGNKELKNETQRKIALSNELSKDSSYGNDALLVKELEYANKAILIEVDRIRYTMKAIEIFSKEDE